MKPFWRVLLNDFRGYDVYPGNKITDKSFSHGNDTNPFTAWISPRHLADAKDLASAPRDYPGGFYVVRKRTGSQTDRELTYFIPTVSANVYELEKWSRFDWVPLNSHPIKDSLVIAFDSQFPNPFKNLYAESRKYPGLLGTDLDWQCYTNPRPMMIVVEVVSLLPNVRMPYSFSDHVGIDLGLNSRNRSSSYRTAYEPAYDEEFDTKDGASYRIVDNAGNLSLQRPRSGRWGPASDRAFYVTTSVRRLLLETQDPKYPAYVRIRQSGSSVEVCKAFAKRLRPDFDRLNDWVSAGWRDASYTPAVGLHPVQLWDPMKDLCGEDAYSAVNMEIGQQIIGGLRRG